MITGLDVADFQVQGLHAIRRGFPSWVGVSDESDILAGPRKDKYGVSYSFAVRSRDFFFWRVM